MRSAACCVMASMMVIVATGVRAQAQTLADPTRPPAAISAPTGPAAQEEFTGTRLQSILLSSGRKVAVINGTMVPLGGMVGDARVVKITETQVVLKTGAETEVLSMYPGIDKRPVKRAAARRGEAK